MSKKFFNLKDLSDIISKKKKKKKKNILILLIESEKGL